MTRRALTLGLLAALLGGCGRRGRLELPKREGGSEGQSPPAAPPAGTPPPQRRSPRPTGLETG